MNKKMTSAALAVAAMLLAGCSQKSDPVAIIDLSAIAAATGEDEVIRQKAEEGRVDLTMQLQQVAQTLDAQLAAEREKYGEKPTAEQQQKLQQLNTQARNTLQDAQQQAQARANQMEQDLVREFREAVQPLAEQIAREKGARAVLAVDSYLFWYEPELDITDEVIAAWRARPAKSGAKAEETAEDMADEMAEIESELEAVEQELEAVEGAVEEMTEQEMTE